MIDVSRLDGKVVLVSGSGRGFGRSLAIAYASAGAKVVSVARSMNELLQTEKAIDDIGGEVMTVSTDLSRDEGIRHVHDQVIAAYGGLDVLVNNAATNSWLTVDNMTLKNWDNIINVNLRAPFALSLAFLPSMKAKGRGNIINITSRSAERTNLAQLAYCPSKFGLEGLTQCLALELKEYNIAVNSLNVSAPSGQRLHSKTLAEALREGGEEEVLRLYKGKRILAVYSPVDWPDELVYQTPEGGFKTKYFI